MTRLFYLLLFLYSLLLIWLIPFGKVEESFGIHSAHDFFYNVPLESMDHVLFPGVVKRSFIGPSVIARIAQFLVKLTSSFYLSSSSGQTVSGLYSLILVRSVLGVINVGALFFFVWSFSSAATRLHAGGALTRRDYSRGLVVFLFAQVHVLFYLSRTLPNSFALGPMLISYGVIGISSERGRLALGKALAIVAATVIVFRFDVAPMGLAYLLLDAYLMMWGRGFFFRWIWEGLVTLAVGLFPAAILSAVHDGPYWRGIIPNGRQISELSNNMIPSILLDIPEVDGFIFNILLNRSHEWGVQAWHWYLSSAIPRVLNVTFPFALIGLVLGPRLRVKIVTLFVLVLFSGLFGHKELRFILYLYPLLGVLALDGLVLVINNVIGWWPFSQLFKDKRTLYNFALTLVFLASIPFHVLFLAVTYHNYPGGRALLRVHQLIASSKSTSNITVFYDVETAMTGANKFLWHFSSSDIEARFNKDERFDSGGKGLSMSDSLSDEMYQFQYVVTSNPRYYSNSHPVVVDSIGSLCPNYSLKDTIRQVISSVKRLSTSSPLIETCPKLYILSLQKK